MKAQIRKDLPNFPEDVVEQFLLPFAEDLGWPPGQYEKDPYNRWKEILRSNDLKYWQRVKWSKEKIKLSPHKLVPKDLSGIESLVQAYGQGQSNIYSLTLKSKDRFDRICSYLRKEGVYPRTVAIEQIAEKFRVIDGCHRLAAYFYLSGWFKIEDDEIPCLSVMEEQEYWVANEQTRRTNGTRSH